MSTQTARRARGVFVVGMHSGGTSAITGALMGLGLGGPIDPPEPSDQHPHGICESPRIWRFNQQLLGLVGTSSEVGTPGVAELKVGWQDDPGIAERYSEAATLLQDAFPKEPWVVKDPRLCVLLPFWRRVVDDAAAAVLVVRNPIDTVRSYEDWLEPGGADRIA